VEGKQWVDEEEEVSGDVKAVSKKIGWGFCKMQTYIRYKNRIFGIIGKIGYFF
jgi:hypothetical protein